MSACPGSSDAFSSGTCEVSPRGRLVRPLMSTTETNTLGMSSSVIGTVTVCMRRGERELALALMPSRSVVTSAVARSHGDWIIMRAVSPGFYVCFSGTSSMRLWSYRSQAV